MLVLPLHIHTKTKGGKINGDVDSTTYDEQPGE